MARKLERFTATVLIAAIAILITILDMASSTFTIQRYEAINPKSFEKYETLWQSLHKSWSHQDINQHFCDEVLYGSTYATSFPICAGDRLIQQPALYYGNGTDQCSKVQCVKKYGGKPATPSDTMEYLPPPSTTPLDNNTICASKQPDQYIPYYSLGLDEGIPPYFVPITPVRLQIFGTVYGQYNDRLESIPDAEIIAWQVDPTRLKAFTIQGKHEYTVDDEGDLSTYDDQRGPFTDIIPEDLDSSTVASSKVQTLRDISCRAIQHSQKNGTYFFKTLMPPSYGPPRHIMFKISAPGFQTLVTRVYFDKDWRLQQLTTLNGFTDVEDISEIIGFNADHNFNQGERFPGVIARDPRVAKLEFAVQGNKTFPGTKTRNKDSFAKGFFRTRHDFVLTSIRLQDQARSGKEDKSTSPAIDIDGLWADSLGDMIQVETHGNIFVAKEYPHSRNWGSVSGYLIGNTIQGVSFLESRQGKFVLSGHDELNHNSEHWNIDPLSSSINEDLRTTTMKFLSPTAASSGVIIPADSFASLGFTPKTASSMIIQWQGGSSAAGNSVMDASSSSNFGMIWTKQDAIQRVGYRYMKVIVTRVYDGDGNANKAVNSGQGHGQMNLNEIIFYEGLMTERELPRSDAKMRTPRYPAPQMVTCSSFTHQDFHCFRAFDGDTSSSSTWKTKAVGSFHRVLKEPQWVLFDFGKDRGIKPTGIRIYCDVANSRNQHTGGPTNATTHSIGCPLTFTVQASYDNIKFDILHKVDLYDYTPYNAKTNEEEYPLHGRMFYFVFDTVKGRINGQRCPSCELGPLYTCSLQGYDGQCDSTYCNQEGLCDDPPECPAGRYLSLEYSTSDYNSISYSCRYCPPGRYGARSGLRDAFCSGSCEAGYYCPEGSTSATQNPCGSVDVYCPEGSIRPISSSAGKYTINFINATGSNVSSEQLEQKKYNVIQSATSLCTYGHYCIEGQQIPCPLGRYGNTIGLMSSKCSGECTSGYYCPVGTKEPIICEPGFYCDDGKVKRQCPAGSYGATYGLTYAICSGECTPGYYCEIGSTSTRSMPCPAGRYGSDSGLKNSNCTALCPAGYYCPVGTARYEDFPCGGYDKYCPLGSSQPTLVSKGFYTVGGTPTTRVNQYISEPGYFSWEGIRRPCPEGSFGNSSGLAADEIPAPIWATVPTVSPTAAPTLFPTKRPTAAPSVSPRPSRSFAPTLFPTRGPTFPPTNPTIFPTFSPTKPTPVPTTARPSYGTATPSTSIAPTATSKPTVTASPTYQYSPTVLPTFRLASTFAPTFAPSIPFDWVRKKYFCTSLCSPGHYCPLNSTREYLCPAGKYGATSGLMNSHCTDDCPLGHYCPKGTITPIPCPGGVFGQHRGLTDSTCSKDCNNLSCNITSSLCSPGYYCPIGSIHSHQYECGGPDKYCPRGSSIPQTVSIGYYSVFDEDISNANYDSNYYYDYKRSPNTRSAQRICEEGYFCVNGVRSPCPPGRYGNVRGLSSEECSGLCPPGHYCLSASVNPKTNRCPRGRYGATYGLVNEVCTGLCEPGYHCMEASTSSKNTQCAIIRNDEISFAEWNSITNGTPFPLDPEQTNVDFLDQLGSSIRKLQGTYSASTEVILNEPNSVYCPQGTGIPLLVLPGYYTIGYNKTTRHDQRACPPGSFCVEGVRYSCPGGRYGAVDRLASSKCSGVCSKGFYCPAGSISSRQHPCPIGRYGAEEGLSTPACSGVCPNPLDCPLGSTTPNPRLIAGI